MHDYKIDQFDCRNLMEFSQEKSLPDSSIHADYVVIRRGLLGKIAIKRFDSYDEFCEFYKHISVNCKEIVAKTKCKRILCIACVAGMSDKILEEYKKILMFDKELKLELVSYEVLLIDSDTAIGDFGGFAEKGRTLMYKDTMKYISQYNAHKGER